MRLNIQGIKNSADKRGCSPQRQKADVHDTLRDLQHSSYPTCPQPHSIIANPVETQRSLSFIPIIKMQIILLQCYHYVLKQPVLVLIQGYKRLEFQLAHVQVAHFACPGRVRGCSFNDLVGKQPGDPLPIEQVGMKSYLPRRKTQFPG